MKRRYPRGSLPEDASRGEQLAVLEAWPRLLGRYDWDWFVTLTFQGDPHPESALKKVRVWISKLNCHLFGRRWYRKSTRVRWVCAIERTRRDIVHCHLLLGGTCVSLARRLDWKDEWERLGGGFARVEEIRSHPSATKYVSKYVTKGGELVVDGLGAPGEQKTLPMAKVTPLKKKQRRSSKRYGEAQAGPQTGTGSTTAPSKTHRDG